MKLGIAAGHEEEDRGGMKKGGTRKEGKSQR